MSRNTSLSILILSLSGAFTTNCVESKCSLSEYACDPACMPHVQVTPSILSLAQDVESTIAVTPNQCQWLQGLNMTIVQGPNVFPIPQVSSTGEIKAKLGNISSVNDSRIQLQPGKATLMVGNYRVEELRLTPRFESQVLTQDLPADFSDSSLDSVGLVSYLKSPRTVESQVVLLSRKKATLQMFTHTVPGTGTSGIIASSAAGLGAFTDSLPNTLSIGSQRVGFISGTGTGAGITSYFQSWTLANSSLTPLAPNTAGRVSSLASDANGTIYASVRDGKTEAFSDSMRMKALSVAEPVMQPTRYLVLVGDLDGDKRGDVVSWDASGQHPVVVTPDPMQANSLLLNTKFQIPNVSIDSANARVPVALGDLNKDGLADLINATKDGIQVYYNNGDGTFYQETATIAPLKSATFVQSLAVAVPAAEGMGVRGLVWVARDSGKTTVNVLKY